MSQSFSDVNVAEAVPVLAQYLAKYEGFVGGKSSGSNVKYLYLAIAGQSCNK